MAYTDRLAVGIIFIVINTIFLIVSLFQLYQSGAECSFSSNKVPLTARILNFCTTAFLVIFAFIDTDFWIWDEDLSSIGDEIFYINICLKGLIDISICITGSMIVLELIRRYFEQELNGEPVPNIINYFWFGIATSFSFIVFVALLIAFASSSWIFVRIYGDIRLFFLFIATTGLAYTYYWVFYAANEEKTHLRYAILLILFSVAAFIGTILSFTYTFITDKWTLYDVVSAGLNDTDSPGEYIQAFVIFIIGWAGYWFVVSWFIKFVWYSITANAFEGDTHNINTIQAIKAIEVEATNPSPEP